MQLLDLPLDCFRYMLNLIARDFDYHEHGHEFLRLRLTNRLLDAEVLRTLATPSFFKWERNVRTLETTIFFGATPLSFPDHSARLPLPSGYPEFVASYLYLKPHQQTPWNANLSSFLNHVVDALLSADGLNENDESRKMIIRKLCCHLFNMKYWKQSPRWWFYDLADLHPQLELPAGTESLEFNVLLASLLLCRRTTLAGLDINDLVARKSNIFGTLLQACIKSGQVKLVTSLLDTGIDVNDESLKVLETGIQCENLDMLNLLLSPKYNLSDSEEEPTRFTKAMTQAIQNDWSEAALCLIYKSADADAPDDPEDAQETTSCLWKTTVDYGAFWVEEAAFRNNFAIVKDFMKGLSRDSSLGEALLSSNRLLRLTIFYGHKDMVRFLQDWGIKSYDYPAMMLAAVCSGDISMVRFLVRECGVILRPDTWYILLLVAVQHATPRHQTIIETMFQDPSIFNGMDAQFYERLNQYYHGLFRYACWYGNMLVINKLVEQGKSLDDFGDSGDTSPVLLASLGGQTAVVDALIKMGAKPVDPMETKYKENFVKGKYPQLWGKRRRLAWACNEYLIMNPAYGETSSDSEQKLNYVFY